MSEFFGQNEYRIDLVMCIDGTASMNSMIETIKNTAKELYMMLIDAMQNNDPPLAVKDDGLRVKVIVFRDFADSNNTPLEVSPFYNLQDPVANESFCKFVDNIQAKGGGDIPENALEAIATALQSEWLPGGRYRRQAIFLFTDTLTYDLSNPKRRAASSYPSGMPRNLEELADIWENGDQEFAPYYSPRYCRMIIFAPPHTGLGNDSPEERTIEWEKLLAWNNVWLVPVKPNGGCDEVDLQSALDVVFGDF